MDSYRYDVYLSHGSADKPRVRNLAERLRNDGLRVWFDDWEIGIGDDIHKKITEGLEESRVLLLAMSRKAVESEWTTLERNTFLFRDPLNQDRRFVPLLLEEMEIPLALRHFKYLDWRRPSDSLYATLLAVCRAREGTGSRSLETSTSKPTSRYEIPGRRLVMNPGTESAICISEGELIVVNVANGRMSRLSRGSTHAISVGATPDWRRVAAGHSDGTVRVWEPASYRQVCVARGHTAPVRAVALKPDGSIVVSGSSDETIKIWDAETGERLGTLSAQSAVEAMMFLPNGTLLVGVGDGRVLLWRDLSGTKPIELKGHVKGAVALAASSDGKCAISGSWDRSIRVWDLESLRCQTILEGHTDEINCVAVDHMARMAVSGGRDNTVRLWNLGSGDCATVLQGHKSAVFGVGFIDRPATVVSVGDGGLLVWELSGEPEENTGLSVRYTNAKVLLVGETGTGKTGLWQRLTQNRFTPSISTDGAWANQMQLHSSAGVGSGAREIWLWDFAGQADYRLMHQLFMDETALAVFVFNPQADEPFKGLADWDRALRSAARRSFRKILVAGRCDVGGTRVSREAVDAFVAEHDFAAYFETSAATGQGCAELAQAIIDNIHWDEIPHTSSPRLFKMLKDRIMELSREGKVLMRLEELKQHMDVRLAGETFSYKHLRSVVGLLAGPGLVWELDFGDFILLQPERIDAYAAAVVRSVRAHKEEVGSISEERVLNGDLQYEQLQRLPRYEEQIVLQAMYQTLLQHALCLREVADVGAQLIFPAYFKKERPQQAKHPPLFVTYVVSGAVEELYTTLIVRLLHTRVFHKDGLWNFAADFRTPETKIIGLKMVKRDETNGDLSIYMEPSVPIDTKVIFIRYVHDHLNAHAESLRRIRHYVCEHCDTPVTNDQAVATRLAQGHTDVVCICCERRIPLYDLIEEQFASSEVDRRSREMYIQTNSRIEYQHVQQVMIGDLVALVTKAGHLFHYASNPTFSSDAEIAFRDHYGRVTGNRALLQISLNEAYSAQEASQYVGSSGDGTIFRIRHPELAAAWQQASDPLMLVMRAKDGGIRWMDVRSALRSHSGPAPEYLIFNGEAVTFESLRRYADVAELPERAAGAPSQARPN